MFILPHHRSRTLVTAAGEAFAVALMPAGGVPTHRVRQAMKSSVTPPLAGEGSIACLTRQGFDAILRSSTLAAFHVDANGSPIIQRGIKIRGRCHPIVLLIQPDESGNWSARAHLPTAYDPAASSIQLARGVELRCGPVLAERLSKDVEVLRSELLHQQRQALHAMTSRWMSLMATAADSIADYRSAA